MKKMKKNCLLFLLLAVTVLLLSGAGSLTARAATTTGLTYGDFQYQLTTSSSKTTAYITGYTGSDEVLVLPDTIDGYTVDKVISGAIADNDAIKEIQIPSTMYYTERSAFKNLANLEKLTLDVSLFQGMDVVSDCPNLTTIKLGAGITNYTESRDENSPISKYEVNSKNTTYATVDGMLTSKDKKTLYYYPIAKTDTEVTITDQFTSVSNVAFYCCKNIETLTIDHSAGWTMEKGLLLSGCTSLKSVDLYHLAGTNGMPAVLENSVKTVRMTGTGDARIEGYFNFYEGCEITSFEFGEGIVNLNFTGCGYLDSSIDEFIIGKDVQQLSDYFAENVSKYATAITVDQDNTALKETKGLILSKDGTKLYAAAKGLLDSDVVVPDGVEEICTKAFEENASVRSVTLPESVTTIRADAFSVMSNFRSITIPASVTTIEDRAIVPRNGSVTINGYPNTVAAEYVTRYPSWELYFVNLEIDPDTITTGDYGSDTWEGDTEAVPDADTINNVIIIKSAAELAWLRDECNSGETFLGKVVKLAADINLAGKQWTPIGTEDHPFEGTFDGQSHTISGFDYEKSVSGYDAIFGYVKAAVYGQTTSISNLKVKNLSIATTGTAAGIAAVVYVNDGANFEMDNCTVTGTVTGSGSFGGIVNTVYCGKEASSAKITNCKSNLAASTSGSKAGIVWKISYTYDYGSAKANGYGATVEECTAKGTMTNGGFGIVGCIEDNNIEGISKVIGCVSAVKISGNARQGGAGIVGSTGSQTVEITQCMNKKSITSGYNTGGITQEVGAKTTISECFNFGYINDCMSGGTTGGIAGINHGLIYNSGSLGLLGFTSGDTGGIVGYNYGDIENCYSAIGSQNSGDGLVSFNGAIAARNFDGASIIHCYFDVSNSDSEVAHIKNGAIVDCDGLSTTAMRTESCFEGWDFRGVWEFDQHYCYGYPTLTALKDKMKQLEDESETVVAKGEAVVTVVDETGATVSGATVTYGLDASLTDTKSTNLSGKATFTYDSNAKGIKVSMSGYETYEDDDFKMPSERSYTVRIPHTGSDDGYELQSVMMTYNTGRYELLAEEKTINLQNKDTKFTIKVSLFGNQKASEYMIVQKDPSDGTEEEIANSTNGEFTLYNSQFEVSYLKKNKKEYNRGVYVRIIDSYDKIHDTPINLKVTNAKDGTVTGLEFGDSLELTLGDETPFLGGSKIKLQGIDMPVTYKFDEEGWEIGVGFDVADTASALSGKSKEEKKSIFKSVQSFEKAREIWKKSGGDPLKAKTLIKNPNISGTFGGYAAGDWDSIGKEFTLTVYIEVSAGWTWEGQVAATPVVWAVDLKGKVKDSTTVLLTNEDGVYLPSWGSTKNKLDGSLSGSLFIGAGAAYVVSCGVYGSLSINLKGQIASEYSGLTNATLSGNAGIAMRLAGKQAVSVQIAEGDIWPIYDRDSSGARTASIGNVDSQLISASSLKAQLLAAQEKTIDTIDRTGYSSSTLVEWNGEADDNSTLKTDAYTDMTPQIMKVGDQTVMLFLDDGGDTRTTENKSTLMYSVYDKDEKTWGTPQAVWDDATADLSFETFTDGTNGYVVWNNEKGSIASGSTIASVGNNSELAIAKLGSDGTFSEAKNVTSNSTYESNPHGTIVDGKVVLSWTVNSQSDMLRMSGMNTAYIAKEADSYQAVSLGKIGEGIVSDSIGILNGELTYTFVQAEDSSDTSTYKGYVLDMDGNVTTFAEENVAGVNFQKIGGTDQLIWNDSTGILHYFSSVGSDETVVEPGVSGIVKQIVTDPDSKKTAVFYTVSGEDKADAYVMIYDGTSWTKALALTDGSDYVETATGAYADGQLVVAYNHRVVDLANNDLDGTNNLSWMTYAQGDADIQLEDVYFSNYDVKAGESLPVTVTFKNAGTGKADGYEIKVDDGTTTYYDNQVIGSIQAGEEITKEIEVPMPESLAKTSLNVSVTPVGETANDNQKQTITVGVPVINLSLDQVAYGDNYVLKTKITNDGYDPYEGAIEFYDVDTGKVYETYDFSSLGSGEFDEYQTSLAKADWTGSVLNIGVRLDEAEGDDEVEGDHDATTMIVLNHEVAPTGMQISQTSISLDQDQPEVQLTATYTPEEATTQEIHWISKNEKVATVSDDGTVKAVASGTTRVYAVSEDETLRIGCVVTVDMSVKATDITLSAKKLRLGVGESDTLTATLTPADCTRTVTWSTSDKNVAEVSEEGVVKAKALGTATITASVNGITATCEVSVLSSEELNTIQVTDLSDFTSGGGNYGNNWDRSWIYQSDDENVKSVRIHFSEDTYTESNYDYIYIYNADGTEIGKYCGSELADKSIVIEGNYVKVRLTSDGSGVYRGFVVDKLETFDHVADPDEEEEDPNAPPDENTVTDVSEFNSGDADSTYGSNWNKKWTYTADEDVQGIRITFSDDTYVEDGYDYIYVLDEDGRQIASFTGFEAAGKSVEVPGNVVTVNLVSDKYETGRGFSVEKLEILDYEPEVDIEPEDYNNVTDVSKLKSGSSSSQYGNNWDKTWVYSSSDDDCEAIQLVFSADTELEKDYDFLYIYDIDDNVIGIYTGDELQGRAVVVPGSYVKLRLVTDFSGTCRGFQVVALDEYDYIPASQNLYAESDNPLIFDDWMTPYPKVYVYGENSEKIYLTKDTDYEISDYVSSKCRIVGAGDYEDYVGTWITGRYGNHVEKITIAKTNYILAAGKSVQLKATVTPSYASIRSVTWKSSNTKYATVSSKGKVTTKSAGAGKTVKIYAIAKDNSGVKATYKIYIRKHRVKSITIKGSSTVKAGKTTTLKATVKTTGSTANKTLKWTSSNSKYATVSSKGVVKGLKAGKGKKVTITATATDGTGVKKTFKIKVK